MSTENENSTTDSGCDCVGDYTQEQYLGLWNCNRQEQPIGFFRELFQTRQFATDEVRWDVLKDNYNNFEPAIMCDPCQTAPLVDSSDNYETKTATGIKLKSMISIDCGELEKEYRRRVPGIECNQITSPEEALRRLLARKSMPQSEAFDTKEDLLAAELVITQKIEIPKSEYLPDGAQVWYPRAQELDCYTSECFGKGQCDTRGILRQWLNKLECFQNASRPTDVLMSCDTWEDFLMGDDMQDCLKTFNPQLIQGPQLIGQLTNRPLIDAAGATLVWTSPEGIRFWKINISKRFCTETGQIEKCDLFPDNYLLALDLSGSACSYQPIMGYTPITDIKQVLGQAGTVRTRYAERAVKNTCTFEPAGWKQVMQSNLLPFIPYPHASSSLTLCSGKTEEAFGLRETQGGFIQDTVEAAIEAGLKRAEAKTEVEADVKADLNTDAAVKDEKPSNKKVASKKVTAKKQETD